MSTIQTSLSFKKNMQKTCYKNGIYNMFVLTGPHWIDVSLLSASCIHRDLFANSAFMIRNTNTFTLSTVHFLKHLVAALAPACNDEAFSPLTLSNAWVTL